MNLPNFSNFNVKDMMRDAGSTISTQMSRVVQVSCRSGREKSFDFFIDFLEIL